MQFREDHRAIRPWASADPSRHDRPDRRDRHTLRSRRSGPPCGDHRWSTRGNAPKAYARPTESVARRIHLETDARSGVPSRETPLHPRPERLPGQVGLRRLLRRGRRRRRRCGRRGRSSVRARRVRGEPLAAPLTAPGIPSPTAASAPTTPPGGTAATAAPATAGTVAPFGPVAALTAWRALDRGTGLARAPGGRRRFDGSDPGHADHGRRRTWTTLGAPAEPGTPAQGRMTGHGRGVRRWRRRALWHGRLILFFMVRMRRWGRRTRLRRRGPPGRLSRPSRPGRLFGRLGGRSVARLTQGLLQQTEGVADEGAPAFGRCLGLRRGTGLRGRGRGRGAAEGDLELPILPAGDVNQAAVRRLLDELGEAGEPRVF